MVLQGKRSRLGLLLTFALGALVASGPQIAIAAFDAVNADKVDGKHAVGASATVAQRAGKLVATNGSGLLPNSIIAKAPDADRLDGFNSTALQRRVSGTCVAGSTISAIAVSGAVSCDADDVDGGNAQTVDGLDATAFARTLRRTIVVSAAGGELEGGAALHAALDAITDNGPGNPWVIRLEPGVYVLEPTTRLVMKPDVSIEGSGAHNTTIICSCGGSENAGSADDATVVGAARSSLHSLTVSNVGSPGGAVGIYSAHAMTLKDVAVEVISTDEAAWGVVAAGGGAPRMEDVRVVISEVLDGTGIRLLVTNGLLDDVEIDVKAAASSRGIDIDAPDGVTTIRNSTIVARSTVPNLSDVALRTMSDNKTRVESSLLSTHDDAASVLHDGGGAMDIAHARLTGNLANTSGEVGVSYSELGGSVSGEGLTQCFGVHSGYSALLSTCRPPGD